jgi:hypothetical protein
MACILTARPHTQEAIPFVITLFLDLARLAATTDHRLVAIVVRQVSTIGLLLESYWFSA